jgi:hypothetical protein
MTPDEIRHIVSTAGPALDGVVSASELVGTTIARIDVDSANDALVNINSTSAAITEAIPVVTDTVRQMADTVAQIDTASVNNTMQQAGEALKGVSTFMQGVTDTLASIKKAVIGAFESFKKGASMIASKIAMVASLIWMKSKSLPSMVWSTIKSAVTYLFPSSAWVKTVEAVDEAVAEPAYAKCISSQAEGVDGSTQSGIFANIGKIASLIAVGTAIHDGVTNRGIGMHLVNLVSSKMQGHGRAANGFEDLFTLLCKGVESAVNAVRHYLGMEKWRMFTRYSKAIDDALMEAYEIEEKEMRDGCAPTMQARHEKILACWHTIRQFRESYKFDPALNHELEKVCRSLSSCAAVVKRSLGEGTGYKPLPVTVCMLGKPGVGKTMMVQALVNTVLIATGDIEPGCPKEKAERLVYCKPFNTEYMDGYHGQPVYYMDDFMLKKATPQDGSNGFTDLMTFYSSFTTLCNMATCEAKGMNPFTSRMILMTTNMTHPSVAGANEILIEPAALNRRIDFNVEVALKPEYTYGSDVPHGSGLESHMLDYSKFEEEKAKLPKNGSVLDCYPWHMWEVFPVSWSHKNPDRVPGTGTSFKKLVVDIIKAMRSRKESHDALVATSEQMLNSRPPSDEELEGFCQGGKTSPTDIVDLAEALGRYTPERVLNSKIDMVAAANFFEDRESVDLEPVRVWEIPALRPSVEPLSYWHEQTDEGSAIGMLPIPTVSPPPPPPPYSGEEGHYSPFGHYSGREPEEDRRSFYERVIVLFRLFAKQTIESLRGYYKWVAGLCLVGGLFLLSWETGLLKFIGDIVRSGFNYIASCFGFGNEVESNHKTASKMEIKWGRVQSGDEYSVQKKIHYNSWLLGIANEYGGDASVLGQAIGLQRDYYVMPLHFIDMMQQAPDGAYVSCRSPTKDTFMNFPLKEFLKFPRVDVPERDLTFIKVNMVNFNKDILHLIVDEDQVKAASGRKVMSDILRINSNGCVRMNFCSSVRYDSGRLSLKGPSRTFTHERWLVYEAPTVSGDCGAPISLLSGREFGNRVLMGLHIGGNTMYHKAFATILDRQLVDKSLAELRKKAGDPVNEELSFAETALQAGMSIPKDLDVTDSADLPFGYDVLRQVGGYDFESGVLTDTIEAYDALGAVDPCGKLTTPVNTCTKSSLTATWMYEQQVFSELVPDYKLEPMKLAPYRENGEVVYPMERALKPFCQPQRPINEDRFRQAVFVAMQKHAQATVNHYGSVWSVKEAVLGRAGANSIPRKTSVGFPMCMEHKDKTYILGKDEQYDVDSPAFAQFEKEIRALEKLIRQGKRPWFAARGFLKDETRKLGKDARYIAGTSLHYYVLCRMYFGEIVADTMSTMHDHGMVCGINPYQDWEWLYNWIQSKGKKVWDGDFAGFDSSQQPQMLWVILEYINDWYSKRKGTSEDNDVRKILFLDLVKSKHVIGKGNQSDFVVQWQKSLPSGHFLTGFVNSILSMSCIVSAYIATTGRTDFWEQCSATTQGDDNLVNASDLVVEQFNQITTAEHLEKEYGMVYTAGRKGEELKPYLDVGEVTFLQRKFLEKNGRMIGPIRLESCLCNMYYVDKGDYEYKRSVIIQMIENNLCELSLHPEEVFVAGAKLLTDVGREFNYSPLHGVENSRAYFNETCARGDCGF